MPRRTFSDRKDIVITQDVMQLLVGLVEDTLDMPMTQEPNAAVLRDSLVKGSEKLRNQHDKVLIQIDQLDLAVNMGDKPTQEKLMREIPERLAKISRAANKTISKLDNNFFRIESDIDASDKNTVRKQLDMLIEARALYDNTISPFVQDEGLSR